MDFLAPISCHCPANARLVLDEHGLEKGTSVKRSVLILLAILVFCFPADAGAAARRATAGYPNSLNMTCAQTEDYIAKNDGGILATGETRASFHSSYCSGQPAFVRTKDARFCYVGQYCDCETTYCSQSYFQGTDN